MFRFYSTPTESSNRVAVVGQHNQGQLDIAVAICGKNENFNRKIGRSIAEGRLNSKKLFRSVKMASCSSEEWVTIARAVALEAGNSKITTPKK